MSLQQTIEKSLQVKSDFEFNETPLAEVIKSFQQSTGTNIVLDRKELADIGVPVDAPVTFSARAISVRAAMNLVFRNLNLCWKIDNEVLLVTSREEAENQLETRVYAVHDLVTPRPSYCFEEMYVPGMSKGGFPRSLPFHRPNGDGLQGGGAFGTGVPMGGIGGGMGMFSVRDNPETSSEPNDKPNAGAPSAQFPRRSAVSGGGALASAENSLIIDMDGLIEAITATLQPSTWDSVGGPGSIAPMGGTLIISQTQDCHRAIEKFLENLRAVNPGTKVVNVRATWLLLDLNQLNELLHSKSGNAVGIDRKALDEMAGKAKGYLGTIACLSGQTVNIASGGSRSAIVGAIPVVGGDETGYQPIVNNPYSAAVLQVSPQLLPNTQAAMLDLCSTVTHIEGPAETASFLGHESAKGKEMDAVITLDRVKPVVSQLATTLKVLLGEPTLVGGLTRDSSEDSKDAAATPQLYLFIEATAQ